MRHLKFIILYGFLLASFVPAAVWAAPIYTPATQPGTLLKSIYKSRPDLRAIFDAKTYLAKPNADTPAVSLRDWARQYGWRQDKKLQFYKPKGVIPVAATPDSVPSISAQAYIVVDKASGLIVAEQNAGGPRPIASLTKLMAAEIVLSRKISLKKSQAITASDKVGGSRLGVPNGSKFSVDDLFYAALLPSANDAANALADSTKLSRTKFVAAMNSKAKALGLTRTIFTDASGIDEGNISTPREFAIIADAVFSRPDIRRYTTTRERTLHIIPSRKKVLVKNSNFLLTQPEYDNVLVRAGKTGFLGSDIGWNLAVSVKNAQGPSHELTVVIFGEPKLVQAMADANTLAQWVWENYQWK